MAGKKKKKKENNKNKNKKAIKKEPQNLGEGKNIPVQEEVEKQLDTGSEGAFSLYNEDRTEALKRYASNVENLDKAILSTSTAVLALSVVFLKTILPNKIIFIGVLYASWVFFCIALISVVFSYVFGNISIEGGIDRLYQYHIDNKEFKENTFDRLTSWSSYASSISFVCGIITILVFFKMNLNLLQVSKRKAKSPSFVCCSVFCNQGARKCQKNPSQMGSKSKNHFYAPKIKQQPNQQKNPRLNQRRSPKMTEKTRIEKGFRIQKPTPRISTTPSGTATSQPAPKPAPSQSSKKGK